MTASRDRCSAASRANRADELNAISRGVIARLGALSRSPSQRAPPPPSDAVSAGVRRLPNLADHKKLSKLPRSVNAKADSRDGREREGEGGRREAGQRVPVPRCLEARFKDTPTPLTRPHADTNAARRPIAEEARLSIGANHKKGIRQSMDTCMHASCADAI
jgi:hypothetical protein